MTKNEFYFSSADKKTKIHAVEWLPEGEPKAVLQIFCGTKEKKQYCNALITYFTKQGFLVVEHDDWESGAHKCGQEEGYTCLNIIRRKYPDVPYLLLGLSRGAITAYSFLNTYPGVVEGVVLADAELEHQIIDKEIPMLQVSGVEKNCQETFRYIYHWTEERLDEMLYLAATKH